MRLNRPENPGAEMMAIGGLGLPVNRRKLLLWFQLGTAAYLACFYFTAQFRTVEILVLTGGVIFAALLPSYLWCAGKVHGLPIIPVFALSTFPAYILPIQRGSELLNQFSKETEAKALLCLIGFLLTITLIWQQMCNNPREAPATCRMMDLQGSTGLLVVFLILGTLFQLAGLIFYQFSGGLFSLVRGYAGNAAMLATFIFAYRLGLGTLTPALKTLLFGVVGLLIVSDAISFILASTLVRLAVIGAGYTLGSQKIPWKSAVAVISLISVLHAGKAEMREKYWNQDGANRSFSLFEYPLIFGEWFANGVKVLGQKKGEGERDVQSAAERGAMVQILFRIMEWSPSRKPFLEGETYKEIPALLVPRILYKEKGIAHIGNWILAYYYEFLTLEGLSKTSVGFDLLSESYANFGYVGMGFLAVFLGIFYAWVGRLSIGVPLLSLRFLFAVLVLSGTFSSNNTMGVFVTTLWQSSMVLLTLGMLLTKKMPNPLYVQAKVAPAKDPGLGASGKGQVAGGGPTSLQASQTREELRRVQDEVATGGQGSVVGGHPSTISEGPSTNSVRHERPKRFVYGKQENKS